jgi:hypothetical protein
MPNVSFTVGQTLTERVKTDNRVLVHVPETNTLTVTQTYAGQVSSGNKVLLTIGNSKHAAAALMPKILTASNTETLQHVELLYDLGSRLKDGQELDADAKNKLLTELSWLLNSLDSERDQDEPQDKEIEQVLTQAVAEIKSGQTIDPIVRIKGKSVSVYDLLVEITGSEPAQHFFGEIGGVINGGNTNGVLVPYVYRATDGSDVPDKFKDSYLTPWKLTAMLTVLDRTMFFVLKSYLESDYVRGIYPELSVLTGTLIRELMPDNPAMIMYKEIEPDSSEATREFVGSIRKRFYDGAVARHTSHGFGIDEEELQTGLERLAQLLERVMPVLPQSVYEYLSLRSSNDILLKKAKDLEHVIDHSKETPGYIRTAASKSKVRSSLREYDSLVPQSRAFGKKMAAIEGRIRNNFGFEVRNIGDYGPENVEDTISFFGEEIGFVRKVLAASIVAKREQ